MPVPASLETRGVSVSDQTFMFLFIVDTEQPSSVQLTLVAGIVPGVFHLREEILVTSLAVEVLPLRGGTGQSKHRAEDNQEHSEIVF